LWTKKSPVQYLKMNKSGQRHVADLQQRQTEGNQEVIRAVLHYSMNSCYTLRYLGPISLNTHRRVPNPHSIRSSLNKLKSAEVRRVASVNYTNTCVASSSGRRYRCFKQRFGRPPAMSVVQAVHEDTATTPIIHLKLLRVPVKYCMSFPPAVN
jgi:hypothetical protein